MSTKKHPTIKAATGFRNMKPDAVYSAANAIYTGLNGNTNIPAPPAPFDLPTLLSANQALSAANSAALDGGRKAVSQRRHTEGSRREASGPARQVCPGEL
jgi:hypothetical protein